MIPNKVFKELIPKGSDRNTPVKSSSHDLTKFYDNVIIDFIKNDQNSSFWDQIKKVTNIKKLTLLISTNNTVKDFPR